MLKAIKSLLQKIIDNIDSGNSDIEEMEALQMVRVLQFYTDKNKKLSKYQSCEYLNISRATFDNYVRAGLIPKGRKESGFKELFWYERDLKEAADKIRNSNV